jgi:hypothetical protein
VKNIEHFQQEMEGRATARAASRKQTELLIADRALTRQQAAELAGTTAKALANLLGRGQGPVVRKRGNVCVYMESEVLRWLRDLPRAAGSPE